MTLMTGCATPSAWPAWSACRATCRSPPSRRRAPRRQPRHADLPRPRHCRSDHPDRARAQSRDALARARPPGRVARVRDAAFGVRGRDRRPEPLAAARRWRPDASVRQARQSSSPATAGDAAPTRRPPVADAGGGTVAATLEPQAEPAGSDRAPSTPRTASTADMAAPAMISSDDQAVVEISAKPELAHHVDPQSASPAPCRATGTHSKNERASTQRRIARRDRDLFTSPFARALTTPAGGFFRTTIRPLTDVEVAAGRQVS